MISAHTKVMTDMLYSLLTTHGMRCIRIWYMLFKSSHQLRI